MRSHLCTLSVLLLLLLSGCVAHDQLINYQGDIPYPLDIKIESPPEIRIQPNDVLSIKVYSSDIKTAAPFNLTPVEQGDNFFSIEAMQLGGYLVDQKGNIEFPVLGTLNLKGLTITEAKEKLKGALEEKYLKDPVINMRILNFTVTVSGEVNSPGTFSVLNERISLPDALALAGDLTGYASRNNVLLVREKDGYRKLNRINLQSAEFFTSEFYYLKQNDLIYVEPIRSKTGNVPDQSSKTVPVIGVAATLVAVILGLIK